jgi:hypothetical protein
MTAILMRLSRIKWASRPRLAQRRNSLFSDSALRLDSSSGFAAAFPDLDRDGDLDVFIGNAYDQLNQVWLNNGVGVSQTAVNANYHGSTEQLLAQTVTDHYVTSLG